jgi:hypothetical protein
MSDNKETFRFGSRASAYYVCVQAKEPQYLPGTSTIIGQSKEILAEFGECEGEYEALDRNGEPLVDPGTGQQFGKTANIRGHFFDSREQQRTKGWTDEEHDRVVARLTYLCDHPVHRADIWLLEDVKLAPPWPTYDTTHHNTVIQIARDTGMLGETLNYEVQNKNRPAVTAKLRELLAADRREREAAEALVA